jgi:hypothetical protein
VTRAARRGRDRVPQLDPPMAEILALAEEAIKDRPNA